jgi:hypothetical protein
MEKESQKTFVILGMHRSATSLVAKCFHENIIDMGSDLLFPAQDNPQGFYENTDFLNLNNDILIKAGGNYLEPPSQEAILETYSFFKSRIIDTIEKHRGEFWGWKDPRTTLTIELFHQHLPNPHYVSLFRSPVEVAKSLHRRNSCSIQKGLITAKEYNYRLIKFLAKHHLM